MKAMHSAALKLHTTNELIEHYEVATGLPHAMLERVIGASIDLLYASRDQGGNMHSSGAICAVEALMAYHQTLVPPEPPPPTPEHLRELPGLAPEPSARDDEYDHLRTHRDEL